MSSLIPNFEYDIFISYRHNDNLDGWVTNFVEGLGKELKATVKEPLSIYFDKNPHDGLLEIHNVDRSLEEKLKCLIFIPIISQTYCDPKSFAWQHEFCVFNKLSKEDQFGRDVKLHNGNVASCILPIKIHDLDAEDKALIENKIGGVLRAIEFIYKEPGVNRPLKASDKKEDNQNHTDYTNQLNKVANAIKEIIAALKNPNKPVTKPSTNNEQSTTQTQSTFGKGALIVSLAILLVAVLSFFAHQKFTNNDQPTTNNEQPFIDKSIAVLPFADLSQNKDQEYFSDGLSEELLNVLAKIPNLKVIARTSSFAFKGKNEDLRMIGEKLGVAHILEGSVRKNGNTLRITAQLIKVDDGTHLWSETYDRTLDDIFKVQDEIAGQVVQQLKVKLLGNKVPVAATMKPEAYNLYMEGKYFAGRDNKENYEKAEAKYKEAMAIDPNAAAVWTGLSNVYANQAENSWRPPDAGFRLAKEAVVKALELSPNYAPAHASLGSLYMIYDWDFDKADEEIKKALELDPGNADVLNRSAILASSLGALDEAIEFEKKAIVADPLRSAFHYNIAYYYRNKGDWAKSETTLGKALELATEQSGAHLMLSSIQLLSGRAQEALQTIRQEPDDNWKSCGLFLVYFKLGRKAEADAVLKGLIEKYSNQMPFQIAAGYAYSGETAKAFEWLERAYQQRGVGLSYTLVDPLLKNLHTDPRWLPFLEKMRLAKYWPEYKAKYLDKK